MAIHNLTSKEEVAIRELFANEFSMSLEGAGQLISRLDAFFVFPKHKIQPETPYYEIRMVTVHDTHNGPAARSKKLGNFRFNWKKLIDQQDLIGFGIEALLSGFPKWMFVYKIIRFGLAGAVVEFDPTEAVVFYCLYNSGALPTETQKAFTAILPLLKLHGLENMTQIAFQKTLDNLARYQVIRIESDRIIPNEEVVSR